MKTKFLEVIRRAFFAFLIVMLGLSTTLVSPVKADSTGFRYPATGVGIDSNIFWVDWEDASNITANDNTYSWVRFYMTGNTDYLYATNFHFAIPEGAIINGIELTVSRFAIKADGVDKSVRDLGVNLLKAGERVGINQAFPYHSLDWPAVETSITYGGANELWGVSWTPAEINATNFGAAFKADSAYADNQAFVDFMQIAVTYTYEGTTLTTSAVSGTYGNTVSLSATLNPALTGESIQFTLNGTTACTGTTNASGYATCSAPLKANAGTNPVGVRAYFGGDPPHGVSEAFANLTVNPRPITVTAVTATKTYDGTTSAAGTPSLTAGSLASGDSATWTQAFDNRNAGTGKTITPLGNVTDGNGGNNYTVNRITASGTINRLAITVTAVACTKTYDGTTSSIGVPTVSSALGSGDTANWYQTFNNKNAGTSKALTPSGTVNDSNGGANYTVTFTPINTGVINKRNITVTADAKSKPYGSSDPPLTYTTNPALFGGDVLTGAMTRATGETVGVYPIVQDTLSGGTNYTITNFTGANFTITLASQTITVTTHAPVRAYKGDTFTVAATSSSGLVVTYSASGGCSNTGANFTMTSNTADCIVHYNQAGSATFSRAPEITEVVLAAEAPAITLQPVSVRVLFGQNATFTAAASGTPAPTVQWQVSTNGGSTFNNLAGKVSATLTITTPPAGSKGYQYRAVFTNASGTATTNAATLHLLYKRLYLPSLFR